MSPFPYTPTVQPDEAPLSVLRRGALGNAHRSVLRYAHSVNAAVDHSDCALGTLARNPELFSATCKGIGVPEANAQTLAYARVGRGKLDRIMWRGFPVRLDHLRFSRSKLCVQCYMEQGYALAAWDHVSVLACPKHRVLLDDACPCCGAPWSPGQDPFACGCQPKLMAERQQSCPEGVADRMRQILETEDFQVVNAAGHLWQLTQYWKQLGIPLEKADMATCLVELGSENWPTLPSVATAHLLHPRVALAPLLATRDHDCQIVVRELLAKPMPRVAAPQLDTVRWTASVVQAVLGIGRVPFKKLVAAGHLKTSADRRYSAASVNELLWRVTGSPVEDCSMLSAVALRCGPYRMSLASLITLIKSGAIQNFNCAASTGLSGLRCELPRPQPIDQRPGLDLSAAAARLGTNTESVRQAIKLGVLPAKRNPSPERAVQWVIPITTIESFESSFVFASAIAKRHGAPVTTMSSRLRSAGLVPTSGPGIDGGVSFIFRRSELERLDLQAVLTAPYTSPAGRKKKGVLQQADSRVFLTASEAARRLEVSIQQLHSVVLNGWLRPADRPKKKLQFCSTAVDELKLRITNEFITLDAAAQLLGQTPNQFMRTWISTGMIRCHDFARKRLIERTEFLRIQEIWEKEGTASSIGQRLRRQRWLCPNLTKMGQLGVASVLGAGKGSVRLYRRTEPILERYEIPIHHGLGSG